MHARYSMQIQKKAYNSGATERRVSQYGTTSSISYFLLDEEDNK